MWKINIIHPITPNENFHQNEILGIFSGMSLLSENFHLGLILQLIWYWLRIKYELWSFLKKFMFPFIMVIFLFLDFFNGSGRMYNETFFMFFFFVYLRYEPMNNFKTLVFAFEKKLYLSPNPKFANGGLGDINTLFFKC